jgi:hypothetical protein
MKPLTDHDPEREERIIMEAIVDCYGPEEQAMGWYYYLDDRLAFPFSARCIERRRTSPLQVDERVQVTAMAPEDDCMHEMFVMVTWQNRELGVPLAQLEPIDVDPATAEAVGDWHYWMAQGYELG